MDAEIKRKKREENGKFILKVSKGPRGTLSSPVIYKLYNDETSVPEPIYLN